MLALALVATASSVAAPAVGVSSAKHLDERRGLAARLGAASLAALHVVRAPGSGVVSFIGTPARQPLAWPSGVDGHTRPAAAARAFVEAHADLLGVSGRGVGLGAGRELPDPAGGHVVRFHQQVGGYPVLGGTVSVSLTPDNHVGFVVSHTAPRASLAPVEVSSAQARRTALAATARASHTATARLRVSQAPTLTVFDPSVIGVPTSARPGLTYRVEVGSRSATAPVRELVLVDAVRGGVVLAVDELTEADQQSVCTANDNPAIQDPTCPPTKSGGSTKVDPSASSDTDVQDAYSNAELTFDFYRDVVGDTSALGLPAGSSGDRALNSTVHMCDSSSTASSCVPMQNAFWDGQEMVYGDGFSSADDVVAHELTHSVTEHTSNLFYWYQSGAINESMSDVMGELVDQWDQSGNDAESERWVIGEDLPASIGPVRDMQHPTTQPPGAVPGIFTPQPDKMTSIYYSAKQTTDNGSQAYPEDNGGVHTNSGVGNKAAYLIVDGGTFNGVTVPGLGGDDLGTRTAAITKAARIYYLADESLPSAADYADLYQVLPAACDQLVGQVGITTGNCATVRDAVTATEMNKQPLVGTAPEAPGCGAKATSTDWFDNLENTSSGRWERSSAHPARGPFYYPQNVNVYGAYSQVYATSGTQEIWGDDPEPRLGYDGLAVALPREGTIAMSHPVRVPVGKTMFLRFNHAYQFEWYPAAGGYPASFTDGGRVEYSVSGGAWQSAAKLFDFGGYNHTMYGFNAALTKILYTFRGFGGDSHGYTSARLNLKSLAGKSVRFRFHMTADGAVGATGWFIDDVKFYTCGARPAAPYPVRETTGGGRVKLTWRAPADHGTSKITQYGVVLKSRRTVLRRATLSAAARSFTAKVRRGKRVTGYVTAINGAGAGPARKSNTVTSR
jgi:Zn-dependent metalloprotease